MDIVIIGSGKVATVFGKLIQRTGNRIVKIYSRDEEHAQALAALVGADYSTSIFDIDQQADLYIISVSDLALVQVANKIKLNNKLVVHTAASVSMEVLSNVSNRYGILYPLQSLHYDMDLSATIPLLINGNTPATIAEIKTFASKLSFSVRFADDEERSKLQLAAVVVNNFSNFLYTLSEEYCARENIEFKLLIPLIHETVLRLDNFPASGTQTGPAIRNDKITIEKHLAMLAKYPDLLEVYRQLSRSIANHYKK